MPVTDISRYRELVYEGCTSSDEDMIDKEATMLSQNQAKAVFRHAFAPNKQRLPLAIMTTAT